MNKKISCLLLSSFLLFSCTNNNVNSKDDVTYNENEDKLDCVSGAFGKENGIYNSKKINSLYIFYSSIENRWNEKSLASSVKVIPLILCSK